MDDEKAISTENMTKNSKSQEVIDDKKKSAKLEKKKNSEKPAVKKATANKTKTVKSKQNKSDLENDTKDTKKTTKTKTKKTTTKKNPEKAPIEIEKELPVEEEKPKVILENIKKAKLFFVSDMDEEATYLHEMSLKGYHFIDKNGMFYIFRQGEPQNYYYHLGYYEKDKRDGENYLDNYTDAGWETIFHEKAEFDGVWNYFRIEMSQGESEPNIFSDRVSRIALYRRLLSSWRSLLAMVFICLLFMIYICYFLSGHPSNLTGIFMTIGVIIFIVIIITLFIYTRAYIKISRKLEELLNI
ncbi:MAG: DUF2812 domain-containing protein [Bacilli bacterium]